MSRKDVVEKLIEELHLMLLRPILFVGENTVHGARIYLGGVDLALGTMGVIMSVDALIQVTESRGWEFSANGAVNDMRKRGLSEEQMVQELILIKIRMLEIVAEGLLD